MLAHRNEDRPWVKKTTTHMHKYSVIDLLQHLRSYTVDIDGVGCHTISSLRI